jgi:hypothetical protein
MLLYQLAGSGSGVIAAKTDFTGTPGARDAHPWLSFLSFYFVAPPIHLYWMWPLAPLMDSHLTAAPPVSGLTIFAQRVALTKAAFACGAIANDAVNKDKVTMPNPTYFFIAYSFEI